MSMFNLPTLAQMSQQRRAEPKHAMVSRLDVKSQARKEDDSAEDKWRKAVRKRDGLKCRWCRRKVVVTMALVPERAEVHHLTPREHKPTRWDVRNAALLCTACHQRVTGAVGGEKATVIAGRTFNLNGREYPDGSGPLNFKVL